MAENSTFKDAFSSAVAKAGPSFKTKMTNIMTYMVEAKFAESPEAKQALREKYLGKQASVILGKAEEFKNRVKDNEAVHQAVDTFKSNASRLKDAIYKLGTENMTAQNQPSNDVGLEK